MKKNSISLFVITLLIAFCYTPSVMAKEISYLGYQYNEPDGSILKKELNFERVSAQYVPKLRKEGYYIRLEDHIRVNNSTILLYGLSYSTCKNWDRYFAGLDSLLILNYEKEIRIDITFENSRNTLRERYVDEIENFDKVIKEYLLPNISIPDNSELSFFCISDDNITKKVKVFSVKNGVVSGRKETAAAEKKAQQAKAAKEQAAYNQLCKQYGKKYADAAVNGRIIVGMPEELMKKLYYCVLRYQSASSKKYDSADARAIIWVTNGRVSSISYY